MKQDIKINSEFEKLIPPLTTDEFNILEKSILTDGCRDALVIWNDQIIDGHNRYKICTKYNKNFTIKELQFDNENNVKIWIIKNQFGRRNLSAYDRSVLALKLEEYIKPIAKENQRKHGKTAPGKSLSQKSDQVKVIKVLAKEAGVSHDTIAKVKKIQNKATDKQKQEIKEGKKSIKQIYDSIRKDENLERIKLNIEIAKKNILPISDRYKLYCDDLLKAPIEPNSVDVIITDPPYKKEYLHVYDRLGQLAKKVLKPEGNMFVMIGHLYMPEILTMITKYLPYRWCLAYLTKGPATKVWNNKINSSWKPILCFGDNNNWLYDLLESEKPDKEYHDWGQSLSGMADIVSKCSKPGETILDPFNGAGTTGIAALKLDRKYIGIDLDQISIDKTMERIWQIMKEQDGEILDLVKGIES